VTAPQGRKNLDAGGVAKVKEKTMVNKNFGGMFSMMLVFELVLAACELGIHRDSDVT
jgi:hypothetical protein